MGLRDRLRQKKANSDCGSPTSAKCSIELKRRRSSGSQTVVHSGQVTEQSLQVWRALPAEIRHDPSMVSFQLEHERVQGSSIAATDDDSIVANDYESTHADDKSFTSFDFMSLKKPSKGISMIEDKSTDDEATHSDHEHNVMGAAAAGNGASQALHTSLQHTKHKSKEQRQRKRMWKRVGLMMFWLFAASVLITVGEKHLLEKTLEVPAGSAGKIFRLKQKPTGDFQLKVIGAFNETTALAGASQTAGSWLTIQPQVSDYDMENHTKVFKNILHAWQLPIVDADLIDRTAAVARNLTYRVPGDLLRKFSERNTEMRLHIHTTTTTTTTAAGSKEPAADFAIVFSYNPLIINARVGSVLAALILLIFYALLVWEVFERPFVAMICSILSVAVLACFDDRPNMDEIIQWMDMELLTLLFCMMILILILTETGVFDYIAVFCYEISGGKIWPMVYSLCFVTCLVSSVLDNMTTVLLMTPVAIRLCEVMSLDPVPLIMAIIVHANVGGSMTPIGDPISIIISTNHYIAEHGVSFLRFVEHTVPGVLITVVASCIYLRLYYRDIDTLRLNEPKEIKELRREIKVWQRASNAISSLSKDAELVRATLNKKVKLLKRTLRRKQHASTNEVYAHTLEDLKEKYPIKNKKLLLQATATLCFVIVCFFIQSVPTLRTLPLGWVALLGIMVLLIVMDRNDMEHLMHRVEWTTLLFFAAMFVMMECVERLGLFAWIGELTEDIIRYVDERNRLAMAIFIILWISALASAILDSIPVTAMMVKVVISLVAKDTLGVPLQPLVWALAFGPSLGGNGTLYGASSNVIAAGIAEQHGYKITFTRYLITIFPMMLTQLACITVYLLVAHIIFEWH